MGQSLIPSANGCSTRLLSYRPVVALLTGIGLISVERVGGRGHVGRFDHDRLINETSSIASTNLWQKDLSRSEEVEAGDSFLPAKK
jgi:hypothetical protein